mmetsp:Transcript_21115/g.58188  ORF Transcript_21115/g.58188 Transcript_21115/m.58188 type:complete len:273 (-) Transcript_21115:630-1448(-)
MASFAFPSSGRPLFCARHRLADHVNIRSIRKRCQYDSSSRDQSSHTHGLTDSPNHAGVRTAKPFVSHEGFGSKQSAQLASIEFNSDYEWDCVNENRAPSAAGSSLCSTRGFPIQSEGEALPAADRLCSGCAPPRPFDSIGGSVTERDGSESQLDLFSPTKQSSRSLHQSVPGLVSILSECLKGLRQTPRESPSARAKEGRRLAHGCRPRLTALRLAGGFPGDLEGPAIDSNGTNSSRHGLKSAVRQRPHRERSKPWRGRCEWLNCSTWASFG